MTSGNKDIGERYRVVILGGGIHGVGVAHDLVSRGWRDILVVEKATLGAGTSSRSTKLIHGGLRYLEHIRDFPLVAEGLRERSLLLTLAPDLVKPLPLLFPVLKTGGVQRLVIKAGLTLYDFLAGSKSLGNHYSLSKLEVNAQVPNLDLEKFKHFYVFYDGQTDDLGLVNRVACSAQDLGATIVEGCRATKIGEGVDSYNVQLTDATGRQKVVNARFIVNATGPWAHEIMESSQIVPKFEGVNNKGSHILVEDFGLKMGVFLQSPEDGRIFFVLPWEGKTLIGTTETPYNKDPDQLTTSGEDVRYLLEHCNRYFTKKFTESDVITKFSGLRWLAKDKTASLSDTTRSHVVSEHYCGQGVLYTIYGGKLTAYRALAKDIGDLIAKSYGDDTPSRTHDRSSWVTGLFGPVPQIPKRFENM